MKRIVFTVATGKPKFAEMAMGLGRSLRWIGDLTPRVVVTDLDGYDWHRYFDEVIKPPRGRSALDKMLALEVTDADQILSLDSDMLAFRRLDPVFDFCEGMPFAVQGYPQSTGEWHGGEVSRACARLGVGSIPRFNGGLLYYERTPQTETLIEEMRKVEADYADCGFDFFRGNASEEICVALAMAKTGIGGIVPEDTNFQNTAVGLIGKLHLDMESKTCKYVCRRHEVRYVEPYVFHAARYVNSLAYWRQLAFLERMERIEKSTRPGFRTPWMKFKRSVQRRYMKNVLKKW